ncbi:MAG TPA: TonB-dependent receptor plug domain-containing protein, partial [Burkholderiaceae bacterium]|nr:TonB-dependent receptor plug domain-containing protein [Burkholderiaceae bacterium]
MRQGPAYARFLCLALAGAANLGTTSPARAQDDAPGASMSPPNLEEAVITARRRPERLQDAPLAATVESGDQLQEQDAVVFGDVGRLVPNVRMVASPQSASALDITMRGQTVNRSAIVFDSAVGLYVDGVYVANGQGAMSTLLDIDSVEIVRGAQGTLFGRNNTGGSISFHTNRPQLDAYSAEVAGAVGSDRLFMGRGIVNVPLGDTFGVRLAYQDNERKGYGSSVGSGQDDFGNQHRYQARLGALWRPNDAFNAYMTFERFDAKEAGALLHPLPGTQVDQLGQAAQLFPQLGLPAVTVPTDPYQTDAGLPSHDDTTVDATQLTLSQAIGEFATARLILGYRKLSNDTAIDIDATTLPLADTTLQNTSSQKSAELQLAGAALDRRLDWVAGLYGFRDDGSAPSTLAPASPQFVALLQQLQTGAQLSPYPVAEQNAAHNTSNAAFAHG